MSLPAQLDVWDYVSLSVMIALSTMIAFYHVFQVKKSKSNTKEFLVSGKDIGFLPVVLSTVATAISPISFVGYPLEIYMNGLQFTLVTLAPFVAMPIFDKVFLPVYFNLGISSVFQYLEFRFNRTLRIAASLLNTVQMVLYTSCVIYAPSLAINQVTGFDLWTSVITIGVICIVYTALGGIKAVIWADVIQLLVIFIAILIVMIKGLIDVGGVSEIYRQAWEGGRLKLYVSPSPNNNDTIWTFLIGFPISFIGFMTFNQMFIQRFLSNRNLRKARQSLYMTTILITIVVLLYFAMGFTLYAKYHDCDPLLNGTVSSRDQMIPLFAVETLQFARGFSGIFVAGVLCASLSTLSSVLNALSAVTLTDYIKPFYPHLNDARTQTLSKILAVVYGVICISLVALAANMGGVMRAVFTIGGATGGPLFTAFVLGVTLPWTNQLGAMAGFVASFVVGLWAAIGSLLRVATVPSAPVSAAGCNVSSTNYTLWDNLNMTLSTPISNFTDEYQAQSVILDIHSFTGEFFLYTMSPVWYSTLTIVVGLTVGLVVSSLTGVQNPEEVDSRLISPAMEAFYRSLPEKCRLFLGYKSEKVKIRNYDLPLVFNNEKDSIPTELTVPLQSSKNVKNDYKVNKKTEKHSNGP